MNHELELKAVVDQPAALRKRLLAAGAAPGFRGRMTDRRYDRDGELAARDEVLRVRTYHRAGGTDAQLSWKGPTTRTPDGYKHREELEFSLAGAASPAALLERLGFEPVFAIDRHVEYYSLAGATLRIEWYPRMDVLLEVEGEPAAIERAIAATGLPRDAFTADQLAAFVARYQLRTGAPAVLAASGDAPLPAESAP